MVLSGMGEGWSDEVLLLELEFRLFRCSVSSPLSPPSTIEGKQNHPLIDLIESVVKSIEKGDYVEALSSDAARIVFSTDLSLHLHEDSINSATIFYSEVEKNIDSFILQHANGSQVDKSCSALLLMCIGVSAFLAFTQNNVTGPCQSGFPSLPLHFLHSSNIQVGVEWDMWARNQLLTSTGSELLAKFSLPQYIVYAKMLLLKTRDMSWEENKSYLVGTKSISCWLSRLVLLQQRILDELSSTLFDLLQVLIAETLDHFGKVENIKSYWGSKLLEGEASTIVSMTHLEAGIVEYTYGRVDQSRKHFHASEEASGLQLSVTGVLGFRTLHQVEAKAQRVLVTNISQIGGLEFKNSVSTSIEDKLSSDSRVTFEASDILMTPKLLENGKDVEISATMPLEAVQQAVILARCLLIEKSTPYGEMQRWDMSPFIEAVDAQQHSYFIIRCFCDILRVRWESTRSRTKERALMMMGKLVQSAYESSPGAAQRICYSYGVYVPTVPALRKEYGELLVSCGMMGEALRIFEDLELWDNLIHCYCLLEKKAAAVELIKARLCETPNDPRLWCSLGDVTNTESYYRKALEVSNDRSARAKRSLARSAYNKGDYEASKLLWESAMALNSLYPDGWFALGAAALKARDTEKALDGFTRAVQLDPDNGEAWNNIACLHMIKKKNKEAFIAFKEALKFRRNSWQLWENFSQVAENVGNFGQALEATNMVLILSNNKRIDANMLDRIMIEMESRKRNPPSAANGDLNSTVQNHQRDSCSDVPKYSDHSLASTRETEHLLELLGKVLQQIVCSGKGDDVWGIYARWHKIKGDLTMCSEALLKQVRSYQGSDLWSDKNRFKKYASASLQLCEVYMDISLATGSRRELSAAEMHLRNIVKQAVSFTDMDEFRALEVCLNEVRERLQAI